MVLSVFATPVAATASSPSIDQGSQEVASGGSISGTFQTDDTNTDVQIALDVDQDGKFDSANDATITVPASDIGSTETAISFSGLNVPSDSTDGTADVVFLQQSGTLSDSDSLTGGASTTVTIDDAAPTASVKSAADQPDAKSTESALTVGYNLNDGNTVATATLTLTDANGDTLTKDFSGDLATGANTVDFDLTNLPDGSAAEGDYDLKLDVTDEAGNTASDTLSGAGTIDDQAPSISGAITGDAANGNSGANKKILVQVDEDASIDSNTVQTSDFQVQFFSVTGASVTGNDNILLTLGTSLSNGQTVDVNVQNGESFSDTAGNTFNGPAVVAEPASDGLSPQDPTSVTFQSGAIDAANGDSVKVDVTFGSTPESGTTTVTLSDQSQNSISNTASLDTSSTTTTVTLDATQGTLNEESITATATVTDDAGNTNPGAPFGTNNVNKDVTQPTVDSATVSNAPISEAEAGTTETVTVKFSEDLDSSVTGNIEIVRPNNNNVAATNIQFKDNQGTNDEVTADVTIPDNDEEVTADILVSGFADTAGNQMTEDTSNTVDIDTVAPQDPNTVKFQANQINASNENSLAVDVGFSNVPEDGTVTVKLTDATGNTVMETADGTSGFSGSTVTVSSIDASGLNEESITASAKIDDTAGNTNSNAFVSGESVNKDTVRPSTPNSVTVQNDDDGQAALTSGDSTDSVAVDVGFTSGLSEDGTVTVELTDGSGNTVSADTSGTSGDNTVTVTGLNATKLNDANSVTPSAKVTDTAGNDDKSDGSLTSGTSVTKDTAGPTIENFAPVDGNTVGSTPSTITVDISDVTDSVNEDSIAVTITDNDGTALEAAGTGTSGVSFSSGTLTIDTTSSGIDETFATGDVTVDVTAEDTLANSNQDLSTFTVAEIGAVSIDNVNRDIFGVVDDEPTGSPTVTVSSTANGNTVQETTDGTFTLSLEAADGTTVGSTDFDVSNGEAQVNFGSLTSATTSTGEATITVETANGQSVSDSTTVNLTHETKDISEGFTLSSTPMNVDNVVYTEDSVNDITTWDDEQGAYVSADLTDVNQGYYVEASSGDAIVGYEYDTSATETPGTATLEAGWNLVGSNYDISSGDKGVTKTADTDLQGFSTTPAEIVVTEVDSSSDISNYEGYWVYVGSDQTRVLEVSNYDSSERDSALNPEA